MKSFKIVYMGSPEFAVPGLELLQKSQHQILAVVSNPDKRRSRGGGPVPTDLKKRAIELKLPVIDAEDVHSPQFLDQIENLNPDLLVVVAFRILPNSILEIPKRGAINVHASLLPKYRGAAPIHWAIIRGEKETGCTVFFLNEKVDTGQIIAQKRTAIGEKETTGELYERLKIMGAELLVDCVDRISEENYTLVKQNDEEATSAPKLTKENTRINFMQSASDVHNMVRGLNPFPIAWCSYEGFKMNIYRVEPDLSLESEPGKLFVRDGKLYAGCAGGSVQIVDVQLPGTKVMSGQEFVNGYSTDVILR
jgi:methionyl-tRNA formyltransferase